MPAMRGLFCVCNLSHALRFSTCSLLAAVILRELVAIGATTRLRNHARNSYR